MTDNKDEQTLAKEVAESVPTDKGHTKTFSQEELDAILKDRLDRERKKYADYADLKTKAAEFEKLQAEKLSETEKAAKKLIDLEKRIAEKEAQIAARDLRDKKRSALEAAKLGLPDGTAISDILDMFPGAEDDIPAQIEKFQKLFPARQGLGSSTTLGSKVSPPDGAQRLAEAQKVARETGDWSAVVRLKQEQAGLKF
jgi:hypothetical protein